MLRERTVSVPVAPQRHVAFHRLPCPVRLSLGPVFGLPEKYVASRVGVPLQGRSFPQRMLGSRDADHLHRLAWWGRDVGDGERARPSLRASGLAASDNVATLHPGYLVRPCGRGG